MTSGTVVLPGADDISFGTVRRGYHCGSPVLIRFSKSVENNLIGVKLFLQDDGGLSGTQFGYYVSPGFTGGLDYTNLVTNHFVIEPGSSGAEYPADNLSGVSLGVTGGQFTSYVWLDVEVGAGDNLGTSQASYRLVYDYN